MLLQALSNKATHRSLDDKNALQPSHDLGVRKLGFSLDRLELKLLKSGRMGSVVDVILQVEALEVNNLLHSWRHNKMSNICKLLKCTKVGTLASQGTHLSLAIVNLMQNQEPAC